MERMFFTSFHKFIAIEPLLRMLTREKFHKLPKTTVPEVLRCNMSSVILQLLAVGVKDVEKFEFLERPPKDALHCAMRLLKLLGAVDGGASLQSLFNSVFF